MWWSFNRFGHNALKFGFVVDGRGTILPTPTRRGRGDTYPAERRSAREPGWIKSLS